MTKPDVASTPTKKRSPLDFSSRRQGWVFVLVCFCIVQVLILRPGQLSAPSSQEVLYHIDTTGGNVTVPLSYLAKQDATIAILKNELKDIKTKMKSLQTSVDLIKTGASGGSTDQAAVFRIEDTLANVERKAQLALGSHDTLAKTVKDLKSKLGDEDTISDFQLLKLKADLRQLERDWNFFLINQNSETSSNHSFHLEVDQLREENPTSSERNNTNLVFTHSINPLATLDDNERNCFQWSVNYDEWLTHHVEWHVSEETDKYYCLARRKNQRHIEVLQSLYNVQFRGDCSRRFSKRMWSSGWGADLLHLLDGFNEAMRTKEPFVPLDNPWHYAAKKGDRTRAVCPAKTMACYFLPVSKCLPSRQRLHEQAFHENSYPSFLKQPFRLYTEYLTRPQTWLRKAVYDFANSVNLPQPCSIVHVRRGDIVLHEEFSRKYFPIEAYLNATDKITKTIFLITDDDNAVIEARKKFPEKKWVVINRPRFKGAEGGWENQVPSDDPLFEVLVLLTIFKLAGQCQVLVRSRSNLSDYISGIMRSVRGAGNFTEVDLSKIKSSGELFSTKNAETAVLSRADW